MADVILDIRGLHAEIDGKPILRGLDLTIHEGETHSIMGPNGSGKSTLAQVLAGHETFDVTGGSVTYKGEDLLELSPHERARKGVFLAFQYPVEIPGVSNMQFLKASLDAHRQEQGLEPLPPVDFMKLIREKSKVVQLEQDLHKRAVNQGFSGGEKKRYEIFQLALLEPSLAILDETDSGLDIDALRIVSEGVNALRDDKRAFLLITHYQRLLDYIVPDHVHVLVDGRIVRSGGKELAIELETTGYAEWEAKEQTAAAQ